ncbi:hypothetical protein PsalN5692_04019 (plasmid) [Piscirickettsia salmonis]|nr:hypothetical protein PsalN5692_04019 [Piscirickettsia salmonis]
MEAKLKHLEMIQGIINRMADNSFLLKGWSVTLISALFALTASSSNHILLYLAYFPCLMFWILDGYFLWQERMYRKLYREVSRLANESIDFSMNATKYKKDVRSLFCVCFALRHLKCNTTLY